MLSLIATKFNFCGSGIGEGGEGLKENTVPF